MKLVASAAKHCCAVLIGAALFLSYQTICAQSPANFAQPPVVRPLNLVVLGDSISWGQGLKDEHKAWYLVKIWLQKMSGREVQPLVEAHSGAVIGSPGDSS